MVKNLLGKLSRNPRRKNLFFKILFLLLIVFFFINCSKEDNLDFEPTDVLVRIKPEYSIKESFSFINKFNHTVEYVGLQSFISDMPADSLNYARNYINEKPYIDLENWPVYGFVVDNHYKVSPRLFGMHNLKYQNDWLETMQILKLNDILDDTSRGRWIFFHVPEGEELYWKKKFLEYSIVDHVELN